MSEERKQSPHYIPELDPENPKHRTGWAARTLLWAEYVSYFVFVLSLVGAGVAWQMEWDRALTISLIAAGASGFMIALSFLG